MPDEKQRAYGWGMVIDLDRCTGCEACVVACHAENNIRISGEEEAAQGRAINWIRIERYWEGEYPNVSAKFMPVLCQHCGNAPCEPVCPVYASYHTPDGLNAQVYNRCIGVRYCGNNCPYVARQFNWFDPHWDAPLQEQLARAHVHRGEVDEAAPAQRRHPLRRRAHAAQHGFPVVHPRTRAEGVPLQVASEPDAG